MNLSEMVIGHLSSPTIIGIEKCGLPRGDVDAGLAELAAPARALIDDLLWWTTALKVARTGAS